MFFTISARHNSPWTTLALSGIGFLLTLVGLLWLQTHVQPAATGQQVAVDLTYICLAPEGPCFAVGSQPRSATATGEPTEASQNSTDFVIIEDIAGRANKTDREGVTDPASKVPAQPVFEDDVII